MLPLEPLGFLVLESEAPSGHDHGQGPCSSTKLDFGFQIWFIWLLTMWSSFKTHLYEQISTYFLIGCCVPCSPSSSYCAGSPLHSVYLPFLMNPLYSHKSSTLWLLCFYPPEHKGCVGFFSVHTFESISVHRLLVFYSFIFCTYAQWLSS